MKSIYLLSSYFVPKIWGGAKLSKLKNVPTKKGEPIGESWEVSNLAEGPSGSERGPLDQWLNSRDLPYLVKFLDTSDYLSVQVHPGDEYAKEFENSSGKTECWFILDHEPGAGIYLGFKEGVSQEEFEQTLSDGGDASRFLNFYPVKKGDFYFVPSGTVHAIGKGVFLCEIQQSSGVTYRVWDWNRVDDKGQGRELHIKKALDVLNFSTEENKLSHFCYKHFDLTLASEIDTCLVRHPDFTVRLFKTRRPIEIQSLEKMKRAISIVNFENPLCITKGEESVSLKPHHSSLCLGEGRVKIDPQGEFSCFIVVS